VLFTVLAGVLWGTSFPAIKIGLQYIDAYTFVFLRFLVASLAMLSVMLLKKELQSPLGKRVFASLDAPHCKEIT
jgi:drug/metabolite transporter (DMT)-like permease